MFKICFFIFFIITLFLNLQRKITQILNYLKQLL